MKNDLIKLFIPTTGIHHHYNTIIIIMYLHKKTTNTCRTVSCNGHGMLPFKIKLQPGQTESKYTRKMLAIKWMN